MLDFWKVEYLTTGREDMRQRANMRHHAKFCGDRSNRWWRMAIFDFRDSGRRHLGFSKFRTFKGRRVKRDKMFHHSKFHRDQSNHWWHITIFRFFKMAATTISDFQNVEILAVGRIKMTKMRYRAKFCGDQSSRCWDMAIFRFFVTASAAILDFKNF